MSDLAKPLAAGLDIRRETRVSAIEGTTLGAGNERLGPFDRIVLAVPAPQARGLGADRLTIPDTVTMVPVWTLLVAGGAPGPEELRPTGGIVDLAVRSLSKPGRTGADGWAVHARSDWSRENLERSPDDVAAQLLAALRTLTGWRPAGGGYRRAHRWRYARTASPLGSPFVASQDGRVLAGGDWALGSDAEHAWRSGAAMAEAVLA